MQHLWPLPTRAPPAETQNGLASISGTAVQTERVERATLRTAGSLQSSSVPVPCFAGRDKRGALYIHAACTGAGRQEAGPVMAAEPSRRRRRIVASLGRLAVWLIRAPLQSLPPPTHHSISRSSGSPGPPDQGVVCAGAACCAAWKGSREAFHAAVHQGRGRRATVTSGEHTYIQYIPKTLVYVDNSLHRLCLQSSPLSAQRTLNTETASL